MVTKMELYVYRHAMMESRKDETSGKEEAGLSDLGRSQVENLAKYPMVL